MQEERLLNGFFTGINYWGLKEATNMWENYDPDSIDEDLRVLRDAGITHLRVFPSWQVFQPLKALYTTSLTPIVRVHSTARMSPIMPRSTASSETRRGSVVSRRVTTPLSA